MTTVLDDDDDMTPLMFTLHFGYRYMVMCYIRNSASNC